MKRARRCILAAAAVLSAALGASTTQTARASDDAHPASFALIIGSNVSVDTNLAPLMYADDDAVLYQELFRVLGARTYLLTRLDENTRRLHPQAAAEAMEPRGAAFDRAVADLANDVAQARSRHVETVVYLVYAGHGNVRNGQGYLALEDRRVTGDDLTRVVERVPATHIHIIADACASYFLAYGRGPGGERRPVQPFQDAPQLTHDPRVGLLLSTSSARESHEGVAFQAGVFSHEVRSGLYGAADADGDGEVSYREIAAFVSRANAAIPNDKFRPDILAHPPHDTDKLLDLRDKLQRRVDIDGAHAAHYWLEDARGVRLVDLNNAPHQPVRLVRPASGTVYVHRLGDDVEFTVPPSPGEIALSDLTPNAPRVASRGAVGEALSLLFALPFDESVVNAYEEPVVEAPRPHHLAARYVAGWASIGAGAAILATGSVLSVMAKNAERAQMIWHTPQTVVVARNSEIQNLDIGAGVAYAVGGVAAGVGLGLLLWPDGSRSVELGAVPSGGYVGYGGRF